MRETFKIIITKKQIKMKNMHTKIIPKQSCKINLEINFYNIKNHQKIELSS